MAISFITEKEKPLQTAIENLMRQPIPMAALPASLVISEELTEDEKPKVFMKDHPAKNSQRRKKGAPLFMKNLQRTVK